MCWFFCFFKQKTAYVMRIRDWSSDVCSSDLASQLNQVIVLDPDEVVFAQQRRQSVREAPVDGPVGLSIAMPELDQVGPIVKDRPQAAVGVAEIAVLMLPRSQIERHEVNILSPSIPGGAAIGVSTNLTAPSEPKAASHAEDLVQCDGQAPGLPVLVRVRHAVGTDDQTRGRRVDRKSPSLNYSHSCEYRMQTSA